MSGSMGGVDAEDGTRASAGGARAAGGLSFQAEVFAWWAAHAVADFEVGFGLAPSTRVEAVGCETGFPVDDVGVAFSDTGYILVQAKGGLRRLDARAKDLRKAVEQVVGAIVNGVRASDGVRSVDVNRDRLVIVTDHRGSQAFDPLHTVCARLREHPTSLALDDAAKTTAERKAFTAFRQVVASVWTKVTGSAPTEVELRHVFRVVEVGRLDFAVDAGVHRVRGETLLERVHSVESFSTLVGIGVEVARERSWRQRHTLATMLGVPAEGTRSLSRDVSRLADLTQKTLARLDRHRVLRTPDGEVRVSRRLADVSTAVQDSLLITGAPGAGKSGLVADLADALPGDKVVLAVDTIPMDRALAQVQWKLAVDLAEVLRSWDGPEPATLLLDGLDAHRGGASWLIELVDELRDSRWRVIATIRRFELTHSHRWRQLFPGSPVDASPTAATLSQVRHLVIPNFDNDELAGVTEASPSLRALLAAGGDRIRELLANPFTLSLVANLLGQVPVERLATFRTQAQVLAAYWQAHVLEGTGGYARGETASQLVKHMTTARSLEIIPSSRLGGVDLDAVEQLLHCGVLEEVDDGRLVATTKPIRFRHHIVFDYALAASLRGHHGSQFPQVLTSDPNFVVFGRPAIDFHLADMWLAEDNRNGFWDTALDLARTSSSLAVAAAAAIAIRYISSVSDVQRLINAASMQPEPTAMVVHHLASALEAADEEVRRHIATNITAFDELTAGLGNVWLSTAETVRLQAMVRLTTALDGVSPLPRQGPAAFAHAASITRILDLSFNDPLSLRWFGERVLHLIVGALSVDPNALPTLLRCLEQDVTEVWGLLPLLPVLEKLAEVAGTDPAAAGPLAAAPFLFAASDERQTPLGSSLILPMRMGWDQAHGMLRSAVVRRGWSAFENAHPAAAMEALAEILDRFTDREHQATPLAWNGITGQVARFGARLELARRREVGQLVAATVASMATRATRGDSNDASLRIWTMRIAHPDAWVKLLQEGTTEPILGMQLRTALLETGGLFADLATRAAAIRLAAALSPLISGEDHQQLEQTIISLPASEADPARQRHLAAARDQALLALDPSRIQTESGNARRNELALTETEQSLPNPVGPHNGDPAMGDDDHWHLWGIDPTAVPETVRNAIARAGDALADQPEPIRWAALASAVAADPDLAEPTLRSILRNRIGRLVNSLLDSDKVVPTSPIGDWIANVTTALACDTSLPSPPEELC